MNLHQIKFWLSKWALVIVVVLTIIVSFIKLNKVDLSEWDESRNGVNAYEMYFNKDYVNLYYANKPDTWNNKPPLLIWMIVASYKVFGFNEFALRFPSAIATVIFFIFCFRITALYETRLFALGVCLILISSKGIIGHHVGRTGDFDALLLCLLTLATYYFLKFIDFNKKPDIIFCCLFLAMAFYCKGTAVLILLPCFLIYVVYKRKFIQTIKTWSFWIGLLVFMSIVFSWFLIINYFGVHYNNSHYGTKNAFETMLFSDTFGRVIEYSAESSPKNGLLFFLSTIDSKLNLWNYLFYVSLLIIAVLWLRGRINLIHGKGFLIFSLIQISTIAILVGVMRNKHIWYLTPIFMYIAIVILYGFYILNHKIGVVLFASLFIYTFFRNIFFIYNQSTTLHDYFKNSQMIYSNEAIFVLDEPHQDFLLYLMWSGKKTILISGDKISDLNNGLLIFNKERGILNDHILFEYKNNLVKKIYP